MRKQVIEIFSEWIAYYVCNPSENTDKEAICRQWVQTNYPEATEETIQAVVDSFDQKPDAICSWELTPKRILNIIIKQEKKPNNINNNENE